jgi:hypothetical protein
MPDTNPPQERGATNSDYDQRQTNGRLTALLHIAEGAFATQRRRALLREFGPPDGGPGDLDDVFHSEGRLLTCCIMGRTTRRVPCLNPNYIGCPFRDHDSDHERTRGRTRGCDN